MTETERRQLKLLRPELAQLADAQEETVDFKAARLAA
jgi:hypothetical protein